MADIPPPPINHPAVGSDGKLTPEWVRWIAELVRVIRGMP
jgi:hypothetical protein